MPVLFLVRRSIQRLRGLGNGKFDFLSFELYNVPMSIEREHHDIYNTGLL